MIRGGSSVAARRAALDRAVSEEYTARRDPKGRLRLHGPPWLPDELRPQGFDAFTVPSVEAMRSAATDAGAEVLFLVAAISHHVRRALAVHALFCRDGLQVVNARGREGLHDEDLGDGISTVEFFDLALTPGPSYERDARPYLDRLLELVAVSRGPDAVDTLKNVYRRATLPLRGGGLGPDLDKRPTDRLAQERPDAPPWRGVKVEVALLLAALLDLLDDEVIANAAHGIRPRARPTKAEIALGVLAGNPGATITEVAKRAGCARSTLYRARHFMTAWRIAKAQRAQAKGQLPRGFKAADGEMDAWSEPRS